MFDVQHTTFGDYRALELRTDALRLVVVTSRGPRIAFFGRPDGENLLYWAPRRHRRGDWDMLGGHRLWTARPLADESEESYLPDNLPCRTVESGGDGLTVIGALDPVTAIRRGFQVRVLAPNRIQIEHQAQNASALLWSGSLWAVTCSVPTPQSTYCIPLGDGSRWDHVRLVAFDRWAGQGGEGFADEQFTMTRDQYLLRPLGRVNKRMLKADAGIIALYDPQRDLLFAKHAAYDRAGRYPMDSNLALYVGQHNVMVEMETMGAAVTLKPGEWVRHRETWILTKATSIVPRNGLLRGLFA